MSNGHTPGPWELIGDAIMPDPRRHLPDTMLGIANIQDHGSDRPLAVHKANARLIAAAPDLLDALTQCRAELLSMIDKHNKQDADDGSWLYDYQTVVEADAAIAKARGTPC